jgi:hypothetical protein
MNPFSFQMNDDSLDGSTVSNIAVFFLELAFVAMQQAVDPYCDPDIFTDGICTGISLVLRVDCGDFHPPIFYPK